MTLTADSFLPYSVKFASDTNFQPSPRPVNEARTAAKLLTIHSRGSDDDSSTRRCRARRQTRALSSRTSALDLSVSSRLLREGSNIDLLKLESRSQGARMVHDSSVISPPESAIGEALDFVGAESTTYSALILTD